MKGKKIHAVILAAGVGSRLGPLTSAKPKCLTRVLGKPILEWQIDAMVKAHVDQITVVTGYEGGMVQQHLERLHLPIPVRTVHNPNYQDTNNLYSFSLVCPSLKASEHLLLCNGDVVFDDSVLESLVRCDKSSIAAQKNSYNVESMKIIASANGTITNIAKTISPTEASATSIDLYWFTPEDAHVFSHFVTEKMVEQTAATVWTEVALQEALQKKIVSMFPHYLTPDERWYEIDTIEDLVRAEIILNPCSAEIKHISTFFFDIDGTLLIGDAVIPGALELIETLRNKKRTVRVISNNTSLTKRAYVEKLTEHGFLFTEADIITPLDALVHDLQRCNISRIYLVGNSAIAEYLRSQQIECWAVDPQLVVVSFDTELTYDRLAQCCLHLQRGVGFVATHDDKWCPTEEGRVPDAGSILELIFAVTERRPTRVYGKPNPQLLARLSGELNFRSGAAIVGDRVHTDMQLARALNMLGVLVLTGEARRDTIEGSTMDHMLTIPSVATLQELL